MNTFCNGIDENRSPTVACTYDLEFFCRRDLPMNTYTLIDDD